MASIYAPAVIIEPLLPLPAFNAFRVLMESRRTLGTVSLLLAIGGERENCTDILRIVKSTVLSDPERRGLNIAPLIN